MNKVYNFDLERFFTNFAVSQINICGEKNEKIRMGEQNSSIGLNIVGDGAAGKASFVTSFAESSPPHNHDPTGRILINTKEYRYNNNRQSNEP